VEKMNKIDLYSWRKYEIGKLNLNIVTPKVYHTREVTEADNYGIPYVVRSKYNNGVKYRIEKTDSIVPNPKGVISFGAENASFFYQTEEYVSGRDMYYIDTANLDANTCMFLVVCLNKLTTSYSYNYGLFPKLLRKETIMLPALEDGTPDWAMMGNIYKEKKNKFEKKFNKIYRIKANKIKIDVSEWMEFDLNEYFDIVGSATTSKNALTLSDDYQYPYVTTAAYNNGVFGFSDKYTEEGNVLTIDSAVIGTCLYQREKFTASDHVEKLIPKFDMNRKRALFLVTILNSTRKMHNYAYNEKRSQTALKKEKIFLPVNQNGDVDWSYMEKYVDAISIQAKRRLKEFSNIMK
jgi:hypothetical protein